MTELFLFLFRWVWVIGVPVQPVFEEISDRLGELAAFARWPFYERGDGCDAGSLLGRTRRGAGHALGGGEACGGGRAHGKVGCGEGPVGLGLEEAAGAVCEVVGVAGDACDASEELLLRADGVTEAGVGGRVGADDAGGSPVVVEAGGGRLVVRGKWGRGEGEGRGGAEGA